MVNLGVYGNCDDCQPQGALFRNRLKHNLLQVIGQGVDTKRRCACCTEQYIKNGWGESTLLKNVGVLMSDFPFGQIVMTRGIVEEKFKQQEIFKALNRHGNKDWGDLCEEDKKLNDEAFLEGGRLFSAYHINGVKIYIITEWDRSVTTILLPSEY